MSRERKGKEGGEQEVMGTIEGNKKNNGLKLGINGLGRIGKLTLWHHVARKYFDEIVINIGREVGRSLGDLAHYIERDSTYGLLQAYLYGYRGQRVITDVDDGAGAMKIDPALGRKGWR